MKIAHVGNHSAPTTTESYVAVALESLGHIVFRHQENETDWATLAKRVEADDCPLVFWTRTPSYGCDADAQRAFVEECRTLGIITCGLHLDRYWDLARESEITSHPWWRQDHVYTADGGNQARFEAVGVAHRWWRPAISATQCGRGVAQPHYASDVAFVGSHRYHDEWPWRRHMLRHLERAFGASFAQYGRSGHRLEDHQLADAYASVAVVVGDSCLANRTPLYWSNRAAETLGRGGFLLHPYVEGIEDYYADGEHLVLYQIGDPRGLIASIRRWLDDPDGRQRISEAGMQRVIERDTFEVRMAEVLADLRDDHPHLRSAEEWLEPLAREGTTDRIVMREQFTDDTYRIKRADLRGRVVIDVGANIGAFALHASVERGAHVVAIEPEAGNLAVLRKAVEMSGADVEIHAAAVAGDECVGTMAGTGGNAQFVGHGHGTVEAFPLDRWLAEHDDVAVLKIDTEGAEYEIVSASELLGRCERIEIEWHGVNMASYADGRLIGDLVTKLLETHVVEVYGLPQVGGQIHAKRR